MGLMRSSETTGEVLRGPTRKAYPVRSAVLSNTLRTPGDQRAAEGGVEVAFLQQLPGEDLLHGIAALGVDPVGERQFQLVGVGKQVGLVETDEPVEIAPDPGHVAVGGARLDDVLELVSKDGLLVVDARQRRENQVHREIPRAPHDVGAHHLEPVLIGRLGLAVITSPGCRSWAPGGSSPSETRWSRGAPDSRGS